MLNSPLTKFNVLTTRPSDNENGLVGWWTFDDGTGTDWSGNGRNGALSGSPSVVQGIIGSALGLNGSSQYVTATIPGGAPAITTMMAWVKLTNYTNYNTFISSPGGAAGYQFRANQATGIMELDRTATNLVGTSTSSVPLGRWVHVAVSYNDVSGAFVFYINGVIDKSSTNVVTTIPSATIYIGSFAGTSQFFTGSIDDVRIYNRVLAPSEINAIYNQGLAFQQGYPEGEMEALRLSSTIYSLSGSTGSFALTGASAATVAARKLSAGTGSFAMTGASAVGKTARKLSASAGSFALTGATITPRVARLLGAQSGAFSLNGAGLTASVGHRLSAAPGSFALSGASSTLKVSRYVGVATASFALSGSTATLTLGRRLSAAAGSFVLTGESAAPSVARQLAVSPGAFALTGEPATGSLGRFLSVVTGEFTLTGASAAQTRGIGLSASPGAFALGGLPATSRVGRHLAVGAGSFSFSGSSATPTIGRHVAAATGSFVLSGQTTAPRLGYAMNVSAGVFTLEGISSVLRVRSGFPRFRHISLIGGKPETSLTGAKPEVGLIGSKPNITITGSDS